MHQLWTCLTPIFEFSTQSLSTSRLFSLWSLSRSSLYHRLSVCLYLSTRAGYGEWVTRASKTLELAASLLSHQSHDSWIGLLSSDGLRPLCQWSYDWPQHSWPSSSTSGLQTIESKLCSALLASKFTLCWCQRCFCLWKTQWESLGLSESRLLEAIVGEHQVVLLPYRTVLFPAWRLNVLPGLICRFRICYLWSFVLSCSIFDQLLDSQCVAEHEAGLINVRDIARRLWSRPSNGNDSARRLVFSPPPRSTITVFHVTFEVQRVKLNFCDSRHSIGMYGGSQSSVIFIFERPQDCINIGLGQWSMLSYEPSAF